MFLPPLPLADLWKAFVDSSTMGLVIVIIQGVISIVVWSAMADKWLRLHKSARLTALFRRNFDSGRSVLSLRFSRRFYADHIEIVYKETTSRLLERLSPGGMPSSLDELEGRRLAAADLSLVKATAEESLARQLERAETGIGWPATGAAAAPSIGLLGTVWGVLETFQAMAAKGTVLLSEVAPGLSSAMLTTVVGLIIAIPSAVGYNLLTAKLRNLNIQLDGFTDELLARIDDEFGPRND